MERKTKPADFQRVSKLKSGERGIRTPGASQHGSFQDYCNRPLYHLSSASIFLKAGAKVRVFLELTKFYSDFLHKRMKNRTFAA